MEKEKRNSKKVKIFGVPIDLGAQKLGVEMGPNAIRHAGLIEALTYNNLQYLDYGDLVIDHFSNANPIDIIRDVSEELARLTHDALTHDYLPIILGGDHSAAIGSISGAALSAKRLGVLWFDCHPDANTPETSPSGNVHGMPVSIALGYGYPQLVNCAGISPKVKASNICLIGTKDIDKAEREFLDRLGVKMFTLFDIDRLGIYHVMENAIQMMQQCDAIHLSLDIDVMDPLIAPGTGILSKGGLSYREIAYAMEALAKADIITSMDIIEINPLMDIKNVTAELAVELITSVLGGSFGDYERNYILRQRNGM